MTSVKGHNDWLIVERQINDGMTLGKALATLAQEYDGFERMIFDPGTGKISDDINVVLNNTMLISPKAYDVHLNDGDNIVLVPIYSGG